MGTGSQGDKTLESLPGIETVALFTRLDSGLGCDKTLESLPGIETMQQFKAIEAIECDKTLESLPGIETQIWSANCEGDSAATKPLNPYQGLKPL